MAKTTPVACTLTPAELAAQAERWHRLIAQAMTERAETWDGLRICSAPEAEEELRALVTAETRCCPWATWTVEPDGRHDRALCPLHRRGCSYVARYARPASAW